MKITRLCFAALAACLMFVGQASADIAVSDTEPTANILLDQFHTNTVQVAANASNARGSAFSLDTDALSAAGTSTSPAGMDFLIQSLSFQRGTAAPTSIDVVFFEGTPTGFGGTAATAANFATGTGTGFSVLANETHTIPTSGFGDFLTVNLDSPFIANSSDNLGFFVFANGGGGTLNILEGQNAGGGRLSFGGTSVNGPSGARNFNFLIDGEPVPEPSSLIVLGLGVMGVITRRRR